MNKTESFWYHGRMKNTTTTDTSDLYVLPIVLSGFYVFCAMLSNILSLKLIQVPLLNWAVDGGTILYPLSFVVRDMLHKNVGRRVARYTVIYAGVLVALMALLIKLTIVLPADPSWPLQDAFGSALASTWRLVSAGIVVQVLGSLINSAIFSYGLQHFPTRDVIVSFVSNVIALFLDTIFFCVLAFAITYPWGVVSQIVGVNLIFKITTAIIFSPLIRLVERKVDLKHI